MKRETKWIIALILGFFLSGTAALAAPPDHDGDGFNKRYDCNDKSSSIFPGAPEICGDGIDQDCNGEDLICQADPDNDGDSFTVAQGDCNDSNPSIFPTASEICGDGIDQNCNNQIDEGCTIDPPTAGHAGMHYSGPAMCLSCHEPEAEDMFQSVHYQWQGDTPYMTFGPEKQGKISGAVNSYCGNISGNWNGCSACHVGRGEVPETVSSTAQLQNIDCLVCHQKEYKRIKVNGTIVPDTANMTINMDTAVQTVHLPERANCLGCHAKAGGGDAVKRGDLALASIQTTDSDYDVHMATTGADLSCQACHTVSNHRIAGKGSDLRATDLDQPVSCANCHSEKPHSDSTINGHTAKVACQTCHIPIYAKNADDSIADETTEINRSWQKGTEHTEPPFHPVLTKAGNLIPAYRFWNGFSENYSLEEIAAIDPQTGAYPTSRPLGDRSDGKLYPFKYKTSDYPIRTVSQELIPLDTSVFFSTADADAAARSGLVNMGYTEFDSYEWVTTDTYQLLNHQVSPKEQSLKCLDCHLDKNRMDLQGDLGYAPAAPQSSCSIACHNSSKAAAWRYGDWEEYQAHHKKHVDEKGATCIDCHSF